MATVTKLCKMAIDLNGNELVKITGIPSYVTQEYEGQGEDDSGKKQPASSDIVNWYCTFGFNTIPVKFVLEQSGSTFFYVWRGIECAGLTVPPGRAEPDPGLFPRCDLVAFFYPETASTQRYSRIGAEPFIKNLSGFPAFFHLQQSPVNKIDEIFVATSYADEIVKKTIWLFKYRGVRSLVEPLGELWAASLLSG